MSNAVMWRGDNLDEIKAMFPGAYLDESGDLYVDRADGKGPQVIGINYVLHRRDSS